MLDELILDVLMLENGEEALLNTTMRIEGWRDEVGPLEGIQIVD